MKAVIRLLQGLVGGKTKLCLYRKAVCYEKEYSDNGSIWKVNRYLYVINNDKMSNDTTIRKNRMNRTLSHYSVIDVVIQDVRYWHNDMEYDDEEYGVAMNVSYVYKRRTFVQEVCIAFDELCNMDIEMLPYSEERNLQIALTGIGVYVYLDASNKVISIHKDKPSYVKSHKGTILTVDARKQFVQSGFMSCSNGCGELKTYAKIDVEIDNGLIVTFDDDIEEVEL